METTNEHPDQQAPVPTAGAPGEDERAAGISVGLGASGLVLSGVALLASMLAADILAERTATGVATFDMLGDAVSGAVAAALSLVGLITGGIGTALSAIGCRTARTTSLPVLGVIGGLLSLLITGRPFLG